MCPSSIFHLQSAMVASHDTGEPFRCLICLDLVYKPIVLSCGHLFCFWCVHRAMNPKGKSQCPVCRRAYSHFPRVCEMLHFFLMKTLPEEYTRRAYETQDMEDKKEIFSPCIPDSPISPSCKRKNLDQSAWPTDRIVIQGSPFRKKTLEPLICDLVKDAQSCLTKSCPRTNELKLLSAPREVSRSDRLREEHVCIKPSIDEDFACTSCHKLLYRPVVLNCGQVFCEACVDSVQRCPSCMDDCAGMSLHVCLELHQFLERALPASFVERKEQALSSLTSRPKQTLATDTTQGFCESGHTSQDHSKVEYFVHVGVGCDECGMFPIVGDRYRCMNCCDKIGYDLCGSCVKQKGTHLLGRFNQRHSPHHRMQQILSEHWRAPAGPLDLHINDGSIQRRRRQQHLQDHDHQSSLSAESFDG